MCQAWITLCVSSQVCCPLSPPTVLFLHRPARDRRVSLSELWPSGSWFACYAFDCLTTALSRLPFVGSAIRTHLSDAFVVVAGPPQRHTGDRKQHATSQTFLVHAVLNSADKALRLRVPNDTAACEERGSFSYAMLGCDHLSGTFGPQKTRSEPHMPSLAGTWGSGPRQVSSRVADAMLQACKETIVLG
jgi:hypothetical protein